MRHLLVAVIIMPLMTFSQSRLHVSLFGGFSNYFGDLQNKPFTLDQSNGAFGAGVVYDLNEHFAVRSSIMYGKISADDKKNKPSLRFRNLNFQSKISEINVQGEYTLLDMSENTISPYLTAGIALFHFNPYTYDSTGVKYFLHPLSTEGEGLLQYPERKPYKLTQISIPLGAGIKYRVNSNVVLAYEISLRKTFTDYLDDVSKTYVDRNTLLIAKGAKAVELSYRGGELKGGDPNYPAEGTKRGSPKLKDWYYFSGFTVTIDINSRNPLLLSRHGRSSLNCPVKVQ